jgi:hypothetical protein
MSPSARPRKRLRFGSAVALATLAAAACGGCRATSGGSVSLPWCRATRIGERADVDSVLAEIRVTAEQADSATVAMLARSLESAARWRGYVVGADSARSRWVARWAGPPSGNAGPGHEPYSLDGRAAALADRLRRESPRATIPTRASLEIMMQKFGVTLWTGEVRFDLDVGDSLRDVDENVRAIVWQLPRFGETPIPTLPRIAPGEVVAYYERELQGRAFLCPVLPYRVRFPDLERAYMHGGRTLRWGDTKNAYSHEDPTLLPAYLHLLLHADSAVPKPIPGHPDVGAADLWRDATLFGTVRDENGAEVHLELRVKGDTRGYEVRETRVLNEAEAEARRAAAKEFREQLVPRVG